MSAELGARQHAAELAAAQTGDEKKLPPMHALHRTCEDRPPIQRAASLDRAAASASHGQRDLHNPLLHTSSPRSPLLGGRLLGPAVEKMTNALVPRAQRVCDSSRFIRLDYTIGRRLGAGRFASVREGCCRESGVRVAIKIFHRSEPSFNLQAVREELTFMRLLKNNDHCIRLLADYEDWESIYLVQELAVGGSLSDRIKAVRGRFCEQEVAAITVQILAAVAALHEMDIAHRDLKPDNILVMSSDSASALYNRIRLCDFGLCKSVDTNERCALQRSSICGTKPFWAPEMVQIIMNGDLAQPDSPKAWYDLKKADVWAVGVMNFTLLFGGEPFRNEEDKVMFPKICLGASMPSVSAAASGAQDLSMSLLTTVPENRPSALKACGHPWLLHVLGRQTLHSLSGLDATPDRGDSATELQALSREGTLESVLDG